MKVLELIANINFNLNDWYWEQRNQPDDIQNAEHTFEVQKVMKELLALQTSGKKEISYPEYKELWTIDPHEILENAWEE